MNLVRKGEPFAISRALGLVIDLATDKPVGYIRCNPLGWYVGYDNDGRYVASPRGRWEAARVVYAVKDRPPFDPAAAEGVFARIAASNG